MARKDIEFKTSDAVVLRGWLFTPDAAAGEKLPCLVMSHGWTAVKEMGLDKFAEAFISKLKIICLVFDNRGFGASDAAPSQPRLGMYVFYTQHHPLISTNQQVVLVDG